MIGVLNYLTTILQCRTLGLSLMRLPLNIWGLFASSTISLFVFPVLLGAGVLLLADRLLGTSFFVPSGLVIGETLIEHSGGHPLLWQHLFWFFGHPEVYIVIIPAMGITAEILATFIRKPIFGYRIQVLCWSAIVVLSMIVWGHHMYVSGMNPWLGSFFALDTLLITVPSAVLLLCWIASLWGSKIRFTVPMLFALGSFPCSLLVASGFFLGSSWTDIQLHDTYFVVGHFHLTMAMSPVLAAFAGIYYWFPRLFERMMNETLGQIHFWISIVGTYLIFTTMHVMGVGGLLRHSYNHTQYTFMQPFQPLNVFVSIVAFLLAGAQLIFFAHVIWSLFRGPKSAKNPWQANTLEWEAPIPAPHGNWGEHVPVVYRGPYEYGDVDGPDDHVPQALAASSRTG